MHDENLISLCMIVKNEEHNLGRALDSVKDIVDQIVVVDTGSTDLTIPIARHYGADVYAIEWKNDFSAARNESLSNADCEWILVMDADEEIAPESRREIRKILENTDAEGIGVIVRNFAPSGNLVRYSDDVQIRFFRNRPEYRYKQAVHNQISPSIIRMGGKITDLTWIVNHYGYMNNPRKKTERSLNLIQRELSTDPENLYLLFKLGEAYKAMGYESLAKETLLQVLQGNYQTLPMEILSTICMRLAQIELSEDHYNEAEKWSRESLKISDDNPVAMYVLAVASVYQGKVETACRYFTNIVDDYPDEYIDKKDIFNLLRMCQTIPLS